MPVEHAPHGDELVAEGKAGQRGDVFRLHHYGHN
jgi:hypothetical protein